MCYTNKEPSKIVTNAGDGSINKEPSKIVDMLIRHVVLRRYITLYSCDTQGCIAATAGIR